MAWGLHQILTGIHIFLAIMWVGGLLFIGWGIYPVLKIFNYFEQQRFLYTLMKRVHWLFTLAGLGVIITGILLGTVLGPIKDWHSIWHTYYGNIWFTALVIAIATLLWGIFAGYRLTIKVLTNNNLWELAENGNTKPLNKALFIIAATESVEFIGFVALLTCMLLLR